MTFDMTYRTTSNWRQIFKTPTVEFCSFLNSKNRLSVQQEFYNLYRFTFPNLPNECPLKPGRYSHYNGTIAFTGNLEFGDNPLMKQFNFPNGLYEIEILAYTKNDPKVFLITFLLEIKNRLGETSF